MRSRTILCAFALLAAPASELAAQSTTTTTTTSSAGAIRHEVVSIGGEAVDLSVQYVGIDDCKSEAVIEVRLDSVPSNKESIDIWTGENCNLTTRKDTTNNSCTHIGDQPADRTTDLRIQIKASDLISDCGAQQESTPKIWLLAVSTPNSAEDVGTGYAVITTLHLDTRAPAAPTKVKGGSGERQIPVEWATSENKLHGFIVLIDPNPTTSAAAGAAGGGSDEDGGTTTLGGWNGECGSSVLTPGAAESSVSSSITRKTVNESTATSVNLSSGDIAGNAAAVAVVAVDEAGNASPLSALACVHVVPTDGFWDRYQQGNAPVDAGCPCASLGPAHAQSAWPVALVLGFIARSARRRRTS